MTRKDDELSPHVRWIVAAMIALTLVILVFQRTRRAEYVEPSIRAKSAAPPVPDVTPAEGRLKVGPEQRGVRRSAPVLMDEGKSQ